MKKIAVFGATGMLGCPVVRELIKRGYHITALTRNMDKAIAMFPEHVNWIEGDLAQSDKVNETINGSEIIYINLSVDPKSSEKDFQPEREGLINILKSAKWNDVSRILYMSSLAKFYEGMNGFHWWIFQMKHDAVQKLKRSGIPYMVFNPSTFMENYSVGGFIIGQKIFTLGKSKYPNWLIAGEDFGNMVANAIEVVPEEESKEYVIQGPEGFTLEKAAAFFSDRYNLLKLKIVHYPLVAVKTLGLFDRKYDYIARIMEAMNNYPETFQSDETWSELGKPVITFENFIRSMSLQDKVVEN